MADSFGGHQKIARELLAVSYDVDQDGQRACRWCANGYQAPDKPYRHDRMCEIRLLDKYVAWFDANKEVTNEPS